MSTEYIIELILPAGASAPDLERGSLLFVGTATVILRYAGLTILTDPNFLHSGEHVHLGYGVRSKRVTDPAIEFEYLPPLDFVLLSHLHEDHFDREVERKLNITLPIVTTPQAAKKLRKKGFGKTYGLETWQALTVVKGDVVLRITSTPAKHAPGPLSPLLPPVMGSMLEFQTAQEETMLRLYITGDTLLHKQLQEIPRRFPDIDLALYHLGGTKIMGVLLTMDARQGVEAIRSIAPQKVIPIHTNDYTAFKSPLEDFKQAVKAAQLENRVHYLKPGEGYTFTTRTTKT
jgi:L-ascorbate metabolism protein UlaG (beta-lactamase superfamily)